MHRRSHPRASALPLPARSPDDTGTTAFDVAGLRVIVRRDAGSEVVVANLYLLGGSRQLTAETAGVEAMLLEAGEQGTARYPGAESRRALERTGSTIAVEAERDWTMLGLRTVPDELDSAWLVLADRVMRPTLDSAGVALVRAQMLAAARFRRNSPDGLVRLLADSVAFAGHPYAVDPHGSERSLASLGPDALRRYQAAQMVTSRMLLVLAGDVTREDAERLVARTLATLPRGRYVWTLPPPLPPRGRTLTVVPRALPTNYILGYFPGPLAGADDYPAFRVATELLGARLNASIRARRALSYAAYAPVLARGASAGGVYASTTAPDQVLPLITMEIARLAGEGVWWGALRRFLDQFATEYYDETGTTAGRADFLARAELYQGDWRRADRALAELRAVSPRAVQLAAQRYMSGVQLVYLGDTAKVREYVP